jgi:hypothetical protein
MAISIDEWRVDTRTPAPPSPAPARGARPESKLDLRRELERLCERELRLRAD